MSEFEKLRVTRGQLAAFLKDPETVRQFERLISMINLIVPPSDSDQSASAAVAESSARESLELISALFEAVRGIDSEPGASVDLIAALLARLDSMERAPAYAIDRVEALSDIAAKVKRDLSLLQFNASTGRWESDSYPWVDIDFPIIIRTTGPNIPTRVAVSGGITMPQWAVNDFNVCESQELVHGWKEGSEIFWHLHMTTNGLDVTDRYVRFSLEYGYADVNGQWTFPAVFTTPDILIPANTPDKTMLSVSLTSFAPALHVSGHMVATLTRVASAGAAPTNNPWVPMLQAHVQVDTVGSRTRGAK